MIQLQTIIGQLSTLQLYGLAALVFVVVPPALAGGASVLMRKREDV